MKAPTLGVVAALLLVWHLVIGDALQDLQDRADTVLLELDR